MVPPPGEADSFKSKPCGALPHRVKMVPDDKNPGGQVMLVDCANEHKEQWCFAVSAEEFKQSLADAEEAARRKSETDQAAAGAEGLDENVAKLTVTMNLKTQEVTIVPWVPNPGLGIQLAGHALAYFFEQSRNIPKRPADGIHVPDKKELVAPSGRPIKR